MADVLASPLAFEPCEGGTCGDFILEHNEEHIRCPPSDSCSKGGCYCQIFKRPLDAADTDPWAVAWMDHDKVVTHKPKKFKYKCLCVRPILEVKVTKDNEEYTAHYTLGDSLGLCTLDPVVGPLLQKQFKCSGKCGDECKCTLFRLQVAPTGGSPFDAKLAKWERMAKAGDQIKYEEGYLYRCFCLK